jgi:hypothetical protein
MFFCHWMDPSRLSRKCPPDRASFTPAWTSTWPRRFVPTSRSTTPLRRGRHLWRRELLGAAERSLGSAPVMCGPS